MSIVTFKLAKQLPQGQVTDVQQAAIDAVEGGAIIRFGVKTGPELLFSVLRFGDTER